MARKLAEMLNVFVGTLCAQVWIVILWLRGTLEWATNYLVSNVTGGVVPDIVSTGLSLIS